MTKKLRKVKNTNIKPGDFMLVILTLILVIFGIIMVFSSSYYNAINEYSDPYYYLKRDIVWAVSGLVGMLLLAAVPYKVYENAITTLEHIPAAIIPRTSNVFFVFP